MTCFFFFETPKQDVSPSGHRGGVRGDVSLVAPLSGRLPHSTRFFRGSRPLTRRGPKHVGPTFASFHLCTSQVGQRRPEGWLARSQWWKRVLFCLWAGRQGSLRCFSPKVSRSVYCPLPGSVSRVPFQQLVIKSSFILTPLRGNLQMLVNEISFN